MFIFDMQGGVERLPLDQGFGQNWFQIFTDIQFENGNIMYPSLSQN